jgi:amino acid transporter
VTTLSGRPRMTVRGAAALGVGAMVGAGIFALLGEAGAMAGSAVWLSFLIGGVVATLLGYVVAGLGARYPSSGGLVTYLMKGFGGGHVTGVASWLLYFAALIVTSMVAVSFGSYATALFFGDDASAVWPHVFTSGIVIAVAAINILGASLLDRVQSLVVVALLVVFGVFVAATLPRMETALLAPSTYPPGIDIVSSVALTFFAYLGFAVISYAGDDLPDPQRTLPRATYLALGFTTLLYVLISVGVFGTLTTEQVIGYGETALAEAARPVLGQAGFAMMAAAALLATSSSVTANIYGAVGATKALGASGMFPASFSRAGLIGSTRGLTISVVAVLLLANLVDLTAIASLGSVVALMIFLLVAVAGFRLRRETGSRGWVIVVGIAATLVVLVAFLTQTLRYEPGTFVSMIGLLGIAVAMEVGWSLVRRRRAAVSPR